MKISQLALALLVLGLPTVGWAIEADEIHCAPTPLGPIQIFTAGVRTCPGSATPVADPGMCVYNVPCTILTPEVKQAAAQLFNAPSWNALTEEQRDTYMNGRADAIPTVLSCGGGRFPAGSVFGVCPPPSRCLRDTYMGIHPAMIDTTVPPARPGIFRADPRAVLPAGGAR